MKSTYPHLVNSKNCMIQMKRKPIDPWDMEEADWISDEDDDDSLLKSRDRHRLEGGDGLGRASSEGGDGLDRAGSEGGSGLDRAGSEGGSGLDRAGSEGGSGLDGAGSEGGSGLDRAGSGSGLERAGSEGGSGLQMVPGGTFRERIDDKMLLTILKENNFNWFSFVEAMKQVIPDGSELIDECFKLLDQLSESERQLVEVSRKAYLDDCERKACADDLLETDSESEDACWSGITDILSDKAKSKVAKERRRIKSAVKDKLQKCLLVKLF